MKLAILLFCCAVALGQDTSPAPESKSQNSASPNPEQKTQSSESNPHGSVSKYGANMTARAAIQQAAEAAAQRRNLGGLEILSDTKGVDFTPYLKGILKDIRENWYHLIPECAEMMKGKLAIEFAITKDGKVPNMRLVATSGLVALDRPAWGSITASNPFPPLPSEFTAVSRSPDALLLQPEFERSRQLRKGLP